MAHKRQGWVQRGCRHSHDTAALQVARADAKDIVFDQQSRSRLQAGINKVADAVGVTLGPRGALQQRSGGLQQLSAADASPELLACKT